MTEKAIDSASFDWVSPLWNSATLKRKNSTIFEFEELISTKEAQDKFI